MIYWTHECGITKMIKALNMDICSSSWWNFIVQDMHAVSKRFPYEFILNKYDWSFYKIWWRAEWSFQIPPPSHIIINYKHIDFISWQVSFPFSKISHLKKLAILTIFSTSNNLPCQMHSKWSDRLPIPAWFYRRQSMSCVQLST